MIFNLYKCEMKKFKKEIIIFTLAIIIVHLYDIYNIINGSSCYILLATNFTFTFFALGIILSMSQYRLFSQDSYNNNSKISSFKIIFIKLLACVTQFVIYTILVFLFSTLSILLCLYTNPKLTMNMLDLFLTFKKLILISLKLIPTLYLYYLLLLLAILQLIFLTFMITNALSKPIKFMSFPLAIIFICITFSISNFLCNLNTFHFNFIPIYWSNFIYTFINVLLFFSTSYFYSKQLKVQKND